MCNEPMAIIRLSLSRRYRQHSRDIGTSFTQGVITRVKSFSFAKSGRLLLVSCVRICVACVAFDKEERLYSRLFGGYKPSVYSY